MFLLKYSDWGDGQKEREREPKKRANTIQVVRKHLNKSDHKNETENFNIIKEPLLWLIRIDMRNGMDIRWYLKRKNQQNTMLQVARNLLWLACLYDRARFSSGVRARAKDRERNSQSIEQKQKKMMMMKNRKKAVD